jgi:hypothetical protein
MGRCLTLHGGMRIGGRVQVQAPETYKYFREAVIDGLARVREHLSVGNDIQRYAVFPSMHYLESGLPAFHYCSGKWSPVDYKACFSAENAPEKIPSWEAFAAHVTNSPQLRSYFAPTVQGRLSPDGKFFEEKVFALEKVARTVEHFIDHYIHVFETADFDDELFVKFYTMWENAVFLDELHFDILVPIIYVTCDFDDTIDLGHASIEKMSEELQLTRSNKHFCAVGSLDPQSPPRDWLEGAATHALVLKGWYIENRLRGLPTDADAFSEILKTVDLFIAALRAVTGHDTGYSQLVIRTMDWADPDHWEAFLPDFYIVSVRGAYPDHFEKAFADSEWLVAKPPVLTEHDCRKVANIFHKIEESRVNKLILAARRLNAACLRRNEEDSILDVVIGLETLLVDDTWNDTGYWLAKRLQGLCNKWGFESHSPAEVFGFCKAVYQFRSAVVHGSPTLEKKRLMTLAREKTIPTVALGIQLLRYAIVVLAENQEYLDVNCIDRELGDN